MGPDEYHDGYPGREPARPRQQRLHERDGGLVLCRARGRARTCRPSIAGGSCASGSALTEEELAHAGTRSAAGCSSRSTTAVISQFEGYDGARGARLGGLPAPLRRHPAARPHPRGRGRRRRTATRLAKQADVLMLFFLLSAEELRALLRRLGYAFEPELIPRTIEYYDRSARRTGSTLSRVVARLGARPLDRERSWEFFREALAATSTTTGGHDPRGHPPRRDGRDGRPGPALLHRAWSREKTCCGSTPPSPPSSGRSRSRSATAATSSTSRSPPSRPPSGWP